jgi:hypothetical protein
MTADPVKEGAVLVGKASNRGVGALSVSEAMRNPLTHPVRSCPRRVVFDRGARLCRPAHFCSAPKADCQFLMRNWSRWAKFGNRWIGLLLPRVLRDVRNSRQVGELKRTPKEPKITQGGQNCSDRLLPLVQSFMKGGQIACVRRGVGAAAVGAAVIDPRFYNSAVCGYYPNPPCY